MLVLIDNYDSFTYNLVHYFGKLGVKPIIYRNDDITVELILKSKPDAIILSPGPCSPQEAGICVELIQKSEGKIPIFGVCLGHQAIIHAYGGKIVRAFMPVHGKVKTVSHQGDSLFKHVSKEFKVTRYHSLVADLETFPNTLEVIATSAEPQEENMVMAVKHHQYPIYGVQFHPESIRTVDGMQIIKNFLDNANITYQEM